jgi:hypothetical protein
VYEAVSYLLRLYTNKKHASTNMQEAACSLIEVGSTLVFAGNFWYHTLHTYMYVCLYIHIGTRFTRICICMYVYTYWHMLYTLSRIHQSIFRLSVYIILAHALHVYICTSVYIILAHASHAIKDPPEYIQAVCIYHIGTRFTRYQGCTRVYSGRKRLS